MTPPLAFAGWSQPRRVAVLVGLSAGIAALLELARLPAALLLGPMLAAICLATRGATVRMPKPAQLAAQGMIGVMIADTMPPGVLAEIAADWPVFLAGTLATIAAATAIGAVMARSGLLPGTTAIWGSSPGAASVMTLMSEAYGADMRLVAIMQYMRVVACALVASAGALLLGVSSAGAAPVWWPGPEVWTHAALPLALAVAGAALGTLLRVPGGAMLVPMVLAMAAEGLWPAPLALPMPVLVLAYAGLGWSIGMRFTHAALAHAARVMPRVILSILALLAICAGIAGLLVVFAGIDPLTALLATSPGGADSVAIIAAATDVDIPFVMAMQVARLLVVMLAGPMLARLLSRGTRAG